MLIGFFKGDDTVILGNDSGTHLSELPHLFVRYPDLRGLNFGNHGGLNSQLEDNLGDILLRAADLFLDALGDEGAR